MAGLIEVQKAIEVKVTEAKEEVFEDIREGFRPFVNSFVVRTSSFRVE